MSRNPDTGKKFRTRIQDAPNLPKESLCNGNASLVAGSNRFFEAHGSRGKPNKLQRSHSFPSR